MFGITLNIVKLETIKASSRNHNISTGIKLGTFDDEDSQVDTAHPKSLYNKRQLASHIHLLHINISFIILGLIN